MTPKPRQRRVRDILPIPGIPEEDAKKLSRQQRYKLRRYTQGVCVSCGKSPRCELSRTLCTDCLAVQRERMRQRIGASRRHYRSKSYAIPVDQPAAPVGSDTSPQESPIPNNPKRTSPSTKARRKGSDGSVH